MTGEFPAVHAQDDVREGIFQPKVLQAILEQQGETCIVKLDLFTTGHFYQIPHFGGTLIVQRGVRLLRAPLQCVPHALGSPVSFCWCLDLKRAPQLQANHTAEVGRISCPEVSAYL